jgi:hypothetical protein
MAEIETNETPETPAADTAPDLGELDLREELSRALADADAPPQGEGATHPDDPESGAETPTATGEGDGLAAPASWSAAAKEVWRELPSAARDEIRKREREIQTTLSQTAEARKLHEQLGEHVAHIKQIGMDPADYVGNLLNWNAALNQAPAQALVALAGQFIVDPQSARAVVTELQRAYGLNTDDGWPTEDRNDGAAQQQIVSLEQRLRQQELAAAKREWQEFTGAKADGKPAHPHADSVRAEMADLIRANPALTFSEAYARAIYINPEVREKVLAEETRKRLDQARGTASKARAMDTPRGRAGHSSVQSRDDLRGELREQLARSGLRVSEG